MGIDTIVPQWNYNIYGKVLCCQIVRVHFVEIGLEHILVVDPTATLQHSSISSFELEYMYTIQY